MILVDANLLIYAYDSTGPYHEMAKEWIEETFSGPNPVRLPWTNILAFLRITTNSRILQEPYSYAEALDIVREWLALDIVSMVGPGQRHFHLLAQAIEDGQAHGNLIMDAHLVALANEHGLTLCSADRDFARFSELRWLDPLRPAETVHERQRSTYDLP